MENGEQNRVDMDWMIRGYEFVEAFQDTRAFLLVVVRIFTYLSTPKPVFFFCTDSLFLSYALFVSSGEVSKQDIYISDVQERTLLASLRVNLDCDLCNKRHGCF